MSKESKNDIIALSGGGQTEKIAICCILNDSFLVGAEVMLYSFFKRNKWFNGDIIIMHSKNYFKLTHKARGELMDLFGEGIIFYEIDEERYRKGVEHFRGHISQEYFPNMITKLEMFNLKGYDKVLVLDADILITGNLQSLFQADKEKYYVAVVNENVEKLEWEAVRDSDLKDGNYFNCGVLLITKKCFDENVCGGMMEMAENFVFKDLWYCGGKWPEQDIMNLYFQGKSVRLFPIWYNFPKREYYGNGRNLTLERVVHYWGEKPWNWRDKRFEKCYRWWEKEYEEMKREKGIAQ